ncbi:hypothetical protein EX30DRAFT_395324 [Ascodesmis nigricans]|uniref:CAP-Gly domain-containing protein n=1 Tax=Ascodesmis nigricans TaxID=341454 RepID=A0A4S2MYU2_9PEZI|nr:hypothetical protein EX30DRAFT_395324 [Ascodesmis nigricans]
MSSTPLTPAKRFGLGRPNQRPGLQSLQVNSDATSPSPALSPTPSREMLARKASYNQLTQNSLASIPDVSAGYGMRQASRSGGPGFSGSGEVEVGDVVNCPGGMFGTVKFIGSVRGKSGTFVGVELDGDLAGKGKNDGAVDGVQYFNTSQPMSGIFVPLNRTSKRASTDWSQAPPTPTLSSPSGPTALSPPAVTPSKNRTESPQNRMYAKTPTGRPSLQRPESPSRRAHTPGGSRPSLLPPTTPRTISAAGGRYGALSPTPGASKLAFSARVRSESINNADSLPMTPGSGHPRVAQTPRTPYGAALKQPKSSIAARSGSSMGARAGSSLGQHPQEPQDPNLLSPTESAGVFSPNGDGEERMRALKEELAEKERQLEEQATSLSEMEAALEELQSLVKEAAAPPQRNSFDDFDTSQLRTLLREKNEKIQQLTAEFDAHRADFRSTIDTLELASSETARVYEKRIEDLMIEIQELEERNQDVESVARTLKTLEDQVQELEEGLEDARRGEAEARGEVEFLRGEVERCREELRREKEKSAAAVANAAVGKMMHNGRSVEELEKELRAKDDEIRGLKAIIHSLSRDSVTADDASTERPAPRRSISFPNGFIKKDTNEELVNEKHNSEKLQTAIRELEEQINSKATREEELEREIEELKEMKKQREARNSISSDKTMTPWANRASGEKPWRSRSRQAGRSASGSITSLKTNNVENITTSSAASTSGAPEMSRQDSTESELTPIESDAESSAPWCEICETAGHDILTCTNMFGSGPASSSGPNGATAEDDKKADSKTIASNGAVSPALERVSSLQFLKSAPSPPPTTAAAPPPDALKPGPPASTPSPILEKKKSVHLPTLPPMDSELGPAAGKQSGKIEMDKWCALCERDGHDSVDCPLDGDF